MGRNVIHASDHEDAGANARETSVFFEDNELLYYEQATDEWRYE
jgi:nucleoside diphosphate kinase (EC 2.7.4.6)